MKQLEFEHEEKEKDHSYDFDLKKDSLIACVAIAGLADGALMEIVAERK